MLLGPAARLRKLLRSPALWIQTGICAVLAWAWFEAGPRTTLNSVSAALLQSGGARAAPGAASPVANNPAATTVVPAAPVPPPPQPTTAAIKVGRNDTLDRIFRKQQLNLADLATIRAMPGEKDHLDQLRPGETLSISSLNGSVQSLQRRLSLEEQLQVSRDANGAFRSVIVKVPLEKAERTISATIDSSLFEAMTTAGAHDPTAVALAEIFAGDIDFILDIRPGDSFTVTYDEIRENGQYLQDGPILAARFINHGREYLAVRYVAPNGRAGYYSPDGRSMRKAFRRAPLDFTRVSSGFSLHRKHPILNTIRAHKGVDYAAPIGTPVHAAGDGRVIYAGVMGGYGNVVQIQHGNNIVTVYGHLSRFAKGLHVGQRVEQGNIIAFVGMTGLATGPHLHYEYRVNGVHKNPQTVGLPDAVPIDASLKAGFLVQTAPLLASLYPPLGPALVAR